MLNTLYRQESTGVVIHAEFNSRSRAISSELAQIVIDFITNRNDILEIRRTQAIAQEEGNLAITLDNITTWIERMCKSPNILAQIREDLIGIRDLSGRIRTLHANTSQATTDMEHILCRARILEPAEELVGIAKRLTEQYSTSFNEIIGSEIRRLASVTT